MVVIKQCKCINEFQDKTYGKGMRVFNTCNKEGKELGRSRCSVCGIEIKTSKD